MTRKCSIAVWSAPKVVHKTFLSKSSVISYPNINIHRNLWIPKSGNRKCGITADHFGSTEPPLSSNFGIGLGFGFSSFPVQLAHFCKNQRKPRNKPCTTCPSFHLFSSGFPSFTATFFWTPSTRSLWSSETGNWPGWLLEYLWTKKQIENSNISLLLEIVKEGKFCGKQKGREKEERKTDPATKIILEPNALSRTTQRLMEVKITFKICFLQHKC